MAPLPGCSAAGGGPAGPTSGCQGTRLTASLGWSGVSGEPERAVKGKDGRPGAGAGQGPRLAVGTGREMCEGLLDDLKIPQASPHETSIPSPGTRPPRAARPARQPGGGPAPCVVLRTARLSLRRAQTRRSRRSPSVPTAPSSILRSRSGRAEGLVCPARRQACSGPGTSA